MSKVAEWLKKSRDVGQAVDAKIIARLGPDFATGKLSMAEGIVRSMALGVFSGATPEIRAHTMTVLCALYCPHCGAEQPDDPSESCRCVEKH